MANPTVVQINPPNMATAVFRIEGTAPLVIHRFDEKTKSEFGAKIVNGSTPQGKKKHVGRSLEDIFEAAKYVGETAGVKWDGFNAGSIRAAMISACRLVNFKMTLAKMSVFVVPDGWDTKEPLYPLIRIYGKAKMTQMIAKTETDVAMLSVRPMYFPWHSDVKIKFDADQFKLADVTNLLARVGEQVGIGEGRPDSKNSAGMGWGTFEVAKTKKGDPE